MAAEGPAIGIDLGTTYSCVAVWQNNRTEVILNDQGNRTTPSCVAFTAIDRLVGDAAANQAAINPSNTIFWAKRLIGRRFKDPTVQSDIKLWPFKVIEGANDNPSIVVRHQGREKFFSAVEISSMILAHARDIAETYLGTAVKNAVVTVPAYFNDLQRRVTKDAGAIAGLHVMQVINESTAAAIAYGLDKMRAARGSDLPPENVLIFDLGGGTLDVSLLSIQDGVFAVKATAGDTHLGGEDFDNNLLNNLVGEIKRKRQVDVTGNPKAMRRLRRECEKAKRILSVAFHAQIVVDSLHEGIDFETTVTRAKFEELNMGLFRRCMDPVRQCLTDARMGKEDIHEIVSVGGSSRIPKVQQLLCEVFGGKELHKAINPDEAIACGAAIHAAKLSGVCYNHVKDVVLQDVAPLSLGVEVLGGVMQVIVPRNTPVPVRMEHRFTTCFDYSRGGSIKIYEGERSLTAENNFLDAIEFVGIPPERAGVPSIVICFTVDVDGILTVSVVHQGCGFRKQITVVNEKERLSKMEIERMVREAEKYRVADNERKNLVQARSKLESYVYNVSNKMEESTVAAKLSGGDKRMIKNLVAKAHRLLSGSGAGEAYKFESAMRELEGIWCDITTRRFKGTQNFYA